jgi:large subunit ribosomal protein L10
MKVSQSKQEKIDAVQDFVQLLEQYPIVGVVNMNNLPTKQLQNMRAQLRQTVVLRMTKRRLLKKAIEQVKAKKKGIEQLEQYMEGMPAMLFTKDNPFALYKKLAKNKSKAPAKAGQVAPNDIEVKAGPTSFAPGPIIGELGQFGLKAGIEGGKVVIKADTIVAHKGDVINEKLASILTRLGIEPMEIGLDLTAVFENGSIFTKQVLAVDDTVYKNNIATAGRWAFNLAMDIAYPTQTTMPLLVQKAFRDAKGLGVSREIMAKELVADIMAKAHREMLGVKAASGC